MPPPVHILITRPAPPENRHDCPITGCRKNLPGPKATCSADTRRLPVALRNALNAAWDKGRGAGSATFRDALDAAQRQLARKP